ncbi:hypothetical protein GCM10007112_18000 [Vulcanisaeta souniana JCM 11219]|uniref:Uncharacterized protein n=1 Tax=Vulcanisaeta souniana JCM 11219 TaxID=1293586 RepID=A0A830EGW3_9CREN|nr:hypothetical protein GCM10007112_18000 [Vulcanisaeta souniana JCM 11219]
MVLDMSVSIAVVEVAYTAVVEVVAFVVEAVGVDRQGMVADMVVSLLVSPLASSRSFITPFNYLAFN